MRCDNVKVEDYEKINMPWQRYLASIFVALRYHSLLIQHATKSCSPSCSKKKRKNSYIFFAELSKMKDCLGVINLDVTEPK